MPHRTAHLMLITITVPTYHFLSTFLGPSPAAPYVAARAASGHSALITPQAPRSFLHHVGKPVPIFLVPFATKALQALPGLSNRPESSAPTATPLAALMDRHDDMALATNRTRPLKLPPTRSARRHCTKRSSQHSPLRLPRKRRKRLCSRGRQHSHRSAHRDACWAERVAIRSTGATK